MLRLMLVDDHAIFRSGLRALLVAEPDMEVVAEAGDGNEALAVLERTVVDVLVLDLSMPGGVSGSRVADEALRMRPGLPIVVLTMHAEEYYLRELFEIGARGFVLKKSRPEILLGAIRAAHRGQKFVDPALMVNVMDHFMGRPKGGDQRIESLSQREQEVCTLVALGHTSQEIGARLSISARTVESHRRNIMARLDLRTRAELVRFALDHGLLDSE